MSCSGRLALSPRVLGDLEMADLEVPLKETWKKQFMSGAADAPVFLGESVIVPFLNGEVTALSLMDGSRLGRRDFTDGSIAGMILSDSTLFLSLNPERTSVLAYELVTGRPVWEKRVDSPVGAPAADTRHLYVLGGDGLVSFWRTDGSTLWKVGDSTRPAASPVVSSGYLVTNARGGLVTCRNGESGEPAWKRDLGPERIYAPPVICEDRVFVATLSGKVHALNLREGTPIWIWGHDAPIYAPVSCDRTSLFVPASSGRIYRLNIADGRVEWTFDTGQLINLRMAVSARYVVAATNRGDIIVLSRNSGRERWRTRLEGRIVIPPVVYRQWLVVGDDKKWIYAFGPDRER